MTSVDKFNLVAGLTSIQKVRADACPQLKARNPFAAYDALTPDEPSRVWRIATQVISAFVQGAAYPFREIAALMSSSALQVLATRAR